MNEPLNDIEEYAGFTKAKVRENKHISTFNRIEILNKSVDKLFDLVDRIENTDIPQVLKEEEHRYPNPSLAEFLSNSPERLLEIDKRLNTAIDKLDSLLF